MTQDDLNINVEIEVINKLPYAITVHNNFDTIIYENNTAKQLFGIREDNDCKSRWCHHTDYIENSCPLCPGKFSKFDKTPHKLFRKVFDLDQNVHYLEFETIPILVDNDQEVDGYIEIVRDVTVGESIKKKNMQSHLQVHSERNFSIMKYGLTGGETIYSDELYFVEDLKNFLAKLSTFAFIGVLQNNHERTGLYGPLPVLDEENYEMYVYAFSIKDLSIQDPRKKLNELVLLMIIFERNDKIISINRRLINDMIKSYTLKLQSIEDITEDWFDLMKIELNKLIDL